MISRRAFLKFSAFTAAAGSAASAIGCSTDQDADTAATRARATTPTRTEVSSRAIVRQIDHILLRTDDAAQLFAFLTETLKLPVAWPLFIYRGFNSGAVGLGNVNLEVLQPVEGDAPFAEAPGTYPIGLAFEPVTVEGAVRELDARGIAHSEPFDDGIADAIRWTSVDLTGPPECPVLLLVKYSFDQDARRAMLRQQLADANGGPLGIEDVAAVELGSRRLKEASDRWQLLFDPTARTSDPVTTWPFETGPVVRIRELDEDRFERVILRVRSLEVARIALRELHLPGDMRDTFADIDLGGGRSTLRLVEAL